MGAFEASFESQDGKLFFVTGEGVGVEVSAGEKSAIIQSLALILLLSAVLSMISVFHGFYEMARTEAPELTREIAWLSDLEAGSGLIIAGWAVIFLLSAIFWTMAKFKLSQRQTTPVAHFAKPVLAPMTKPLQVAVWGFVMSAFATYGFGFDCFQYSGVGSCT